MQFDKEAAESPLGAAKVDAVLDAAMARARVVDQTKPGLPEHVDGPPQGSGRDKEINVARWPHPGFDRRRVVEAGGERRALDQDHVDASLGKPSGDLRRGVQVPGKLKARDARQRWFDLTSGSPSRGDERLQPLFARFPKEAGTL